MRNIQLHDSFKVESSTWIHDSGHSQDHTQGPLRGRMQVLWLGQAGFLLRTPELSIGIDLYLSDSLAEKYAGQEFPHLRMIPPPVDPQELKNLNLVLTTHGHTDHMDKGTLTAIYQQTDRQNKRQIDRYADARGPEPAPLCIAPRSEMEKAQERGVPQGLLIGLNAGESFTLTNRPKPVEPENQNTGPDQNTGIPPLQITEFDQITVTAIPAAHEQLTVDQWGNYQALGYVIDLHGLRIYHSGDTLWYTGMAELLHSLQIDAALLPVNGRSDYLSSKGIAGNLTVEQASSICREADIPFLFPHHFGMFSFNTVHRADIARDLENSGWTIGHDCVIPEINRVYTIGR